MFDFITHARRCFCVYFHLACFCCFSFHLKKKKIGGEDAEFLFSFDSFTDIAFVFA
jgi:hypothetical protein